MNPNLQSALFYSLTTVAQMLAGAMGLLGAIVLFAAENRSGDPALATAKHKRYVVYEDGHSVPREKFISETLDWLDRYLGLVR